MDGRGHVNRRECMNKGDISMNIGCVSSRDNSCGIIRGMRGHYNSGDIMMKISSRVISM
jgi:hypothetical protein